MGKLEPDYTPAFSRDVKRLAKRHVDLDPLETIVELVCQNDSEALDELKRRHNMHTLKGGWAGSHECHVANADDWLLIWRSSDKVAAFQRTGTHDELFR
ncbi:mRNA interferase YafQ [Olsenella profusa DSM 13989]|uniref:type II toxin-antitoxin system YafQ family toxin n=1 Tax=Olsenella profusa TaxID=138595 RepID=UPI002784ED66|nr:type II toxin-antitoxin system YafQ family toxin [Olsenella profusa]MDP9860503.1 mRNA interferase YafQ [Olsenella profusa DSM 13989]